MSTPEQRTDGPTPEPPVEFESTGLWPIDDPEQTSHIQRPPATPVPPAPDAGSSPHADPERTTVVPRATGNYTQPWAAAPPPSPAMPSLPTPGPAGYAPTYNPATGGYHQHDGGSPQATYQPPGYPPSSSGYPAGPGTPPQQASPTETATDQYSFTPITTSGTGRSRPALLIGGAAVALIAIAAVCVTGFWKPGFFLTRQLNISKVQEGVQHILTDPQAGYGITGVSGLSCNQGQNPSANPGDKFTCDMLINGAKRKVEVSVVDDHGTYQVGKVT